MIKYTMTKKQQFVLCAMYVKSLDADEVAQAFHDGKNVVVIYVFNHVYTSVQTINYLQDLGLVGQEEVEFNKSTTYYALTPTGEKLAKTLFKVLS